jgi:DNA-binding HxlR family transcriptional regulator
LVEEIMQVISDSKTLDIFYSIAKGVDKNDLLKRTKGLTKKQYYSRTRRLIKVRLAQRFKGK